MRCEEIAEWMSERIDGRLDDTRQRLLSEHLAGCEVCRREMAEMEATVGLIRGLAPVGAPPDLPARVYAAVDRDVRHGTPETSSPLFWRVFRLPQVRVAIAAGFVVVVGVYGLMQYGQEAVTEPLSSMGVGDTIDRKEKDLATELQEAEIPQDGRVAAGGGENVREEAVSPAGADGADHVDKRSDLGERSGSIWRSEDESTPRRLAEREKAGPAMAPKRALLPVRSGVAEAHDVAVEDKAVKQSVPAARRAGPLVTDKIAEAVAVEKEEAASFGSANERARGLGIPAGKPERVADTQLSLKRVGSGESPIDITIVTPEPEAVRGLVAKVRKARRVESAAEADSVSMAVETDTRRGGETETRADASDPMGAADVRIEADSLAEQPEPSVWVAEIPIQVYEDFLRQLSACGEVYFGGGESVRASRKDPVAYEELKRGIDAASGGAATVILRLRVEVAP